MTTSAQVQDVRNVLVLGGSGRTGKQVVVQALASGRNVAAFVHDPGKLEITDTHLTVIAGDAIVPADLRAALRGQDAVVDTIGSHRVGDRVVSTTTETMVEAMDRTGVRRVVMMSSFSVAANFRPTLRDRILHPTDRSFTSDMATAEAYLRQSGLDWTIVRAPRLRDGEATGLVRVVDEDALPDHRHSIVRADLAGFLLGLLDRPDAIGRVLVVSGQP